MRKLHAAYIFIAFYLPFLLGAGGAAALAQSAQSVQSAAIPEERSAAVIFAYNMIGEDRFPDKSIRLEQFREQMRELKEEHYNVVPLATIIDAFKNEDNLPPRTIALTFDGGHKSIYRRAVPLLQQYDFPYTVFVSTDKADSGYEHDMSWADLRSIARDKNASFGLHTASYTHIADKGRNAILQSLNNARARFREEMGSDARYFAYPFGEYGQDFYNIIKNASFSAAFGQQSGVAYRGSGLNALPRFVMTEEYGDLERFKMLANALPLPVSNITPPVTLQKESDNRPAIGFNLSPSLQEKMDDITCFTSGQSKPHMKKIGDGRVELRLQEPFNQGRARINCTAIAYQNSLDGPRWRWFGMLFAYPEGGPAIGNQLESTASGDNTAENIKNADSDQNADSEALEQDGIETPDADE